MTRAPEVGGGLGREIAAAARGEATGPPTLSEERARELAAHHGLSLGEVHRAALRAGVCPERYRRNLGAISLKEQLRLQESRAAVVGLGGLGGQVALLLARVGVGELALVDGDRFEPSNLNRQALCVEGTLGCAKAERASEAAFEANPAVRTLPFPSELTPKNAHTLLDGCGVAVDCLDSLPSRFVLQDACGALGIPMVHGTAAGWEGWVTVIPPREPVLDALYGGRSAPPVEARPEAALGVLAPAAAAVGSLQAAEAVKALLGRPGLRGRLLHLDLEGGRVEAFALSPPSPP